MESIVEVIGYIASVLVFATFYVKRILTLRLIAISSNIAFILYAIGDGLHPIFILHSLLLPLNLYRIFELKRNTQTISPPKSVGMKVIDGYVKKRKGKNTVMVHKRNMNRSVYFLKPGLMREYYNHHGWHHKEFNRGNKKHFDNRLLAKLTAVREVRGDTERGTAVYTPVHENSSTVATKQFYTAVEFRKKSN